VLSSQGIEVDPDKVKAIQAMSAPKIEKEVRGFLGCLNYIAQFIYQMTVTCEPIFRLLQKKNPLVWNEECHETFDISSSICIIHLCWHLSCLTNH
jgi:hypothetical protein